MDGHPYLLDIRFRMLQNPELARAMGFDDEETTYEFVGNVSEVHEADRQRRSGPPGGRAGGGDSVPRDRFMSQLSEKGLTASTRRLLLGLESRGVCFPDDVSNFYIHRNLGQAMMNKAAGEVGPTWELMRDGEPGRAERNTERQGRRS